MVETKRNIQRVIVGSSLALLLSSLISCGNHEQSLDADSAGNYESDSLVVCVDMNRDGGCATDGTEPLAAFDNAGSATLSELPDGSEEYPIAIDFRSDKR